MKNWVSIPRRGYVTEPTRIERLVRFSSLLGVRVRIKRDDLLPLGGSKVRKLDYLMEDALRSGADTLITASTNQCCHNSMLALLARREGMHCRVIMESWGNPCYRYEAASNHEMMELCGVDEVAVVPDLPVGPVEQMPIAQMMAEKVRQSGGTPYFMPRGGMGALGAIGYIRCAAEIVEQCGDDLPDAVICPCGIGGTQAGITVGFSLLGIDIPVIGVGVTGKDRRTMEHSVVQQCRELADYLEIEPVPDYAVCCLEEYSRAYGKVCREQVEVMRMLAESEGILTDPVYSGKTLYGLAGLAREKRYNGQGGLLFVHTGGLQLFYDFSSLREIKE